VLVRADGGGWPLPSIGFRSKADALCAQVTLVDIDDARLTSDTQNRLADYRGRGWKVAPFPVQAASENALNDLILPRAGLTAQPG
jgi:hypothetical protein